MMKKQHRDFFLARPNRFVYIANRRNKKKYLTKTKKKEGNQQQ
jgi:hypothetical protein